MSTRGRAWRRAQRARMIQRALKTEMVRWWYYDDNSPKTTERQKFVREIAARYCDILAPCSCYACGNERNSGWLSERDKMTMAERRAEDRYNDQMGDLEC